MKPFQLPRVFPAVLFLLLWSIACVEPFETNLNLKEFLLVIDGSLTDQPDINYVSIRLSYPSSSNSTVSSFRGVNDAQVWLMVDETSRVDLTLAEKGTYLFPDGFRAEEGRSYQLFFQTSDGKQFESNKQSIKKVAPIKNIYQRYVPEGIPLGNTTTPGHKVYVDFDDPAGKGDAYYWTWRLFEKQDYCKSCEGGYYQRSGADDLGVCVADQVLINNKVTYDYSCEVPCWEIIPSSKLVAQNDAFSDGRSIVGKEVAEIPFYTSYGAVLELKQHAISLDAYNFVKLLIDQNQNSGSLADTPSTALVGNVRSSSDETDLVGGYFVLSSVNVVNYFLTRSDMINPGRPIGLLRRPANPEESSSPSRPPLAPCVNSISRTNNQPPNWTNE